MDWQEKWEIENPSHMWELRQVPIAFYGIDEAKEKVLGLDEIGVIAEYEDACSYIYGGFEESKILNFVHVEDVPKQNREKFIKTVKWFLLNQVEKAI